MYCPVPSAQCPVPKLLSRLHVSDVIRKRVAVAAVAWSRRVLAQVNKSTLHIASRSMTTKLRPARRRG